MNARPNATRNEGPLSDSSPTPAGDTPPGGFALAGPSAHPDPRTHAFRQDLADVALAGVVIASHYAEPLTRRLGRPATFTAEADRASEVLAQLDADAEIRVLDLGRGWAWGYVEGRVGYVPAEALA